VFLWRISARSETDSFAFQAFGVGAGFLQNASLKNPKSKLKTENLAIVVFHFAELGAYAKL
jgi:hypothetical protein